MEISGQHKQAFSYDNLDRVSDITEYINAKTFHRGYEYDALGRVKKEIYPSGFYTVNHYDANGYLTKITDRQSRLVWEAMAENARGQLTQEKKGAKITTYSYDERGLPSFISASGVLNTLYEFNEKGNLTYRDDYTQSNPQSESFAYDTHNRLVSWTINGSTTHSIAYNSSTGNIQTKSDIGNYTMNYGENGKPHALTSISGVPTNFPTNELDVTYTDFKKIKTLTEGDKYYQLTYGIDDQRRMSVYKENNVSKETRYYLGNYEEKTNHTNGITEKIHYLSGAIYIERSNGTSSFYYTYTDYLGSLIALTNESGTVVERYAYDPWGKRRNPGNWTQDDSRTTWIVNRGYTGHEHIDQFGIINMNGRVYDPLTAMFFSPDPFVQAPDNWLNYNRYAYAYGNPFRYIDPDGELVWWVIPAIIVGVFFTEPGYQLQKYILPVVYKIELDFGTHQIGIGIKGGVGVPKIASIFGKEANWYEGSAKYYWKDYGDYKGWEFTYGKETTKWGVITEGSTNVIKKNGDKDYSQSIGYKKYGIPGVFAIEHYNDTWGDDASSDKYNTATSKIIFGPFSLENIIFTGEPIKDQDGKYIKTEKTDLFGNKYSVYEEEEGSPRHGIFALRIGPFRIGGDSEEIRAAIQNGYHFILGDPYFQYRPYTPRLFFQIGW